MNYYNPYYGFPTTLGSTASRGLLRGILGRGINWASILNNTQRTLGIINQAIPVVKQVSPLVNNAKTMFRVMNEFKKIDTPTEGETVANKIVPIDSKQKNDDTNTNNHPVSSQGPTFFM